MDFGALICKPSNPDCHLCPVSHSCLGLKEGNIDELPYKKKSKSKKNRTIFWLIPINRNKEVYLIKRENMNLWGGLWSFLENADFDGLITESNKFLDVNKENLKFFGSLNHTFTHFNLVANIYITEIKSNYGKCDNWKNLNKIDKLALPKPIKNTLIKIKANSHD